MVGIEFKQLRFRNTFVKSKSGTWEGIICQKICLDRLSICSVLMDNFVCFQYGNRQNCCQHFSFMIKSLPNCTMCLKLLFAGNNALNCASTWKVWGMSLFLCCHGFVPFVCPSHSHECDLSGAPQGKVFMALSL